MSLQATNSQTLQLVQRSHVKQKEQSPCLPSTRHAPGCLLKPRLLFNKVWLQSGSSNRGQLLAGSKETVGVLEGEGDLMLGDRGDMHQPNIAAGDLTSQHVCPLPQQFIHCFCMITFKVVVSCSSLLCFDLILIVCTQGGFVFLANALRRGF